MNHACTYTHTHLLTLTDIDTCTHRFVMDMRLHVQTDETLYAQILRKMPTPACTSTYKNLCVRPQQKDVVQETHACECIMHVLIFKCL